ncbi:MAG: hypothetical protein IKQ62_08300 [Bacteroidaceae bacterium]|nr:hypothetical protein [Bacteroidaceae bacterium]
MTHRHNAIPFPLHTSLFFPLTLLIVLTFLTACQNPPYHAEYRDLPHHQWDSRDTLAFTLPTPASDTTLTLTLALRTTNAITTRAITTRLHILCDGRPLSTIPVTIPLYDDQQQPLGTGFPIIENHATLPLTLQANHRYTLLLTHHTRLNPLPHIHSIGVLLE